MITKFNFKDRTIKSYAIRKLTPLECFRLMGVRDAVIHIMQSTFADVKQRVKSLFGKTEIETITCSQEQVTEDGQPTEDLLNIIKKKGGKFIGFHKSEVSNHIIYGVKLSKDGKSEYMWVDSGQYFMLNKMAPEVFPMTDDLSIENIDHINKFAEYKGSYSCLHDSEPWKEQVIATEDSAQVVYVEAQYYYLKAKYEVKAKAIKGKDEDMVISASQQYKQAGNSIIVDVLAAIYSQLWYPKKKAPKQQLDMFDMFFADDKLPDYPPHYNPDHGYDAPQDKRVMLTTFSGYDSQLMAADALRETHPDFEWECVGWSDIDKYACQMHDLVFPQYADRALGDITKIDWHKVKDSLNGRDIDLFTYSSPCQDISQAGKQMGLKEGSGSRSALLWNVADAIEVLRPKYLLQENVAALVSEKFMPDFQLWLKKLESLGYVNRWALLNGKDYGVPQNRLRVFCLSMRRDVAFDYEFPQPVPLTRRLEDVLEEEVDERYFLKDDAVSKFLRANDKDSALFLQFPLAPTHENAMFLKTWLQFHLDTIDGWQQTPTALQSLIETAQPQFLHTYNEWQDQGKFPSKEFETQYNNNLKH